MVQKDTPSQKVSTASYDLTGTALPRIVKHYFISKTAPKEENFAGGPGWKCLLLLGFLHGLGRIAGWGVSLMGLKARTMITRLQNKRLK